MVAKASGSAATRKRKMIAYKSTSESAKYDWDDLAENGKVQVYFFSSSLEHSVVGGGQMVPFIVSCQFLLEKQT